MNFMKKFFHLKMKATAAMLFVMTFIMVNGCQNDSSPVEITKTDLSAISARNERKTEVASNLAKILAVDLNQNEDHRQEVFRKVAIRFDGQFEFLIKDLNDNTISQIEKIAETSKSNTSLSKKTDQSFLKSIQSVRINDVVSEFEDLQIFMPYADRWTDNEISAKGGLVVVYYPFGTKDTKIKEMTGYNAKGEKVIITEENSLSIPYILISQNERAAIIQQRLMKSKKFAKAYSSNEMKATFLGADNWKNKKIAALIPEGTNVVLTDSMGDVTDPGDPAPTLPTSTHPFGGTLKIKGFEIYNISNFEPYWTNGEPEFAFKCAWRNNTSGTSRESFVGGIYDGYNSGFLGTTHHYKGGWVYGDFFNAVGDIEVTYNTQIYLYIAEDDGGGPGDSRPLTWAGLPTYVLPLNCLDDQIAEFWYSVWQAQFPHIIHKGDMVLLLDSE